MNMKLKIFKDSYDLKIRQEERPGRNGTAKLGNYEQYPLD